MTASRPPDPRRTALQVLDRLSGGRRSLDRLMEEAYENHRLDQRDRNLATTLVYGVLRRRGHLDWIIAQLGNRPFEKIHPRVLNILRLGLFQLLYLDRVPDSAAVNTAVGLARTTGMPWAAGFVNALLRGFLRAKARPAPPDYAQDPVQALAVRQSIPTWLARRWIQRYGLEAARALARTCNRLPPLTLRANTLRTDRRGLMEKLAGEGLSAVPTPVAPQGVTVSEAGRAVADLRAFREGLFQVQDEAAQLVGHMVSPRPGQRVLDACAGLGGKTGHLAQLMENRGAVTALDNRRWRLEKLRTAMRRLGVDIVETREGDLTRSVSRILSGPYDHVLVDAPCSGLGVLARNPDARWTLREADLARQQARQLRMLAQAAPLVAPGGRLVFAVCSLEPEENEAVVRGFLERHADFTTESAPLGHLPAAAGLVDDEGFLRTFPPRDGMDGFFAAALRRRR